MVPAHMILSFLGTYRFWILWLVWLIQFVQICRLRRQVKLWKRWYRASVQQAQPYYQSQQYRQW